MIEKVAITQAHRRKFPDVERVHEDAELRVTVMDPGMEEIAPPTESKEALYGPWETVVDKDTIAGNEAPVSGGAPPESDSGHPEKAGEAAETHFVSQGELLNQVKSEFGKLSHELCELLGVKNPVDIRDFDAAYAAAASAWGSGS